MIFSIRRQLFNHSQRCRYISFGIFCYPKDTTDIFDALFYMNNIFWNSRWTNRTTHYSYLLFCFLFFCKWNRKFEDWFFFLFRISFAAFFLFWMQIKAIVVLTAFAFERRAIIAIVYIPSNKWNISNRLLKFEVGHFLFIFIFFSFFLLRWFLQHPYNRLLAQMEEFPSIFFRSF